MLNLLKRSTQPLLLNDNDSTIRLGSLGSGVGSPFNSSGVGSTQASVTCHSKTCNYGGYKLKLSIMALISIENVD